jgi:predicted GNAT family acetyltransferase
VERALGLGLAFAEPIPQRIHALRKPPVYPGAAGCARQVTAQDASLFADWLAAFSREAVPHDPAPIRANSERMAAEGRHTFWVVEGAPVAMAGIARRIRSAGAISAVYTPPALRGRGFAGSATAAVAERLFAEGRSVVCLYTDLRNPASNRCYAKIGFEPHCDAWAYMRRRAQG